MTSKNEEETMINTITDDQGNKYELVPIFSHDNQQQGHILVYIAEFQENDIL